MADAGTWLAGRAALFRLDDKMGLGRRDDGRRAYHWPPRFTRPGGEDGDNDWHENDGTGQTSERVARWQARGRNRLGSIWWSFFFFPLLARWGCSLGLVEQAGGVQCREPSICIAAPVLE